MGKPPLSLNVSAVGLLASTVVKGTVRRQRNVSRIKFPFRLQMPLKSGDVEESGRFPELLRPPPILRRAYSRAQIRLSAGAGGAAPQHSLDGPRRTDETAAPSRAAVSGASRDLGLTVIRNPDSSCCAIGACEVAAPALGNQT